MKKEVFRQKRFLFFLIIVFSLALSFCFYAVNPVFSQDGEGANMPVTGEFSAGEIVEEQGAAPWPEEFTEGAIEPISPEAYAEQAAFSADYEEEFVEDSEQYLTEADEIDVDADEEMISLDLKGIDIIELFRLFSLKTGLTIVSSKSVAGRVNLFLNNVTFEDALDVVLITQGLASERRGEIIMIMTSVEYKTRYGKEYDERRGIRSFKLKYAKPADVFAVLSKLKSDIGKLIVDETSGIVILIDIPEKLDLMEQTASDLDLPLETEILSLKYATAEDMKAHLSSVITVGPGELFVDERTGVVVISDLPDKMKKIKRIVRAFDEASEQVFIEAEILQIVLKDEFQRGINWERLFANVRYHNLDYVGTFPVSPSFEPSPALSTANLKMSVGTLASDYYTSTLQLLKTFGDTKILSRPKITVMNNEEAKIMVGVREAYVTQTLSQAESTTVTSESIEFIEVGVKLNVIPTISKEGFITMKIKPEVSSVRETITTSLGSRIPIVETSEAETVVKVKDNTMIMIAGLMKEEKREDITGIPVLSRIPFIGALFGSRTELTRNTELVVFLRPRIITGESAVAGSKPEEWIPSDVLPKDLKDLFIQKEITKIKISPEEFTFKKMIKTAPKKMPALTEKRTEQIELQEKLKGLKEY